MIKRFALTAGFAATGVVLLLSAGCGSGGGTVTVLPLATATPSLSPTPSPNPTPIPLPIDAPISTTGRYQTLVFTLSAPHSVYKAGEVVPFMLTVENTGSEDVSTNTTPLTIDEAAYPDPALLLSPVSYSRRLFPVGTVFKAGQTVTLPLNTSLTAFTSPLSYHDFRVYVGGGSFPIPNTTAPGTELVRVTVVQ